MTSNTPQVLQSFLADRYLVERELGRGGMASVYLARELKHGRSVAIKVLRPELAAALGPDRFLREIRIAARLNHPHILGLIDSGEIAGSIPPGRSPILYYVMPYVEGESLRDRLEREPQLPLEDALQITRDVAAALAHAHREGIVHRDIKPENILLSQGMAVVADFGIARAVGEAGEQKLTETGIAIGTPAYMSPEQGTGERSLDGRADQYALGCVLYEMLAGQPPFTGPTAQAILARHAVDPVPPLATVRRQVPEGVIEAIERAMAKVPAERFPTMDEFATAVLSDRTRQERKAASRSRSLLRARVTAAVGLLAVVAVGLLWHPWKPGAPVLDTDLLAIAPFEVHDPALEVWREGLVDVLSRDLDGAGPLRTVPTSVLLRRWEGPVDRAGALALGQRTGARLVAFGDLALRGRDSVTLRLTLLDGASNSRQGDVEATGAADRMTELTDSLARRLLRLLGRSQPVAAVREGAFGNTSLPVLKAFLRGEHFYRLGLYDSALVAYDQAISQDSGFTLALWRMSNVIGWGSPLAANYAGGQYNRRAIWLNHGQAPLDSLFITADSCDVAADSAGALGDLGGFVALHRRAAELTREAARRYPGNPEAWYRLGEMLYHFPAQFMGSPAEARAAFDRAIQLDSGFAPAYEHLPMLGVETGGLEAVRTYLEAWRRVTPPQARFTSLLGFFARVFDSGPVADRVPLLDTVPGPLVFQAMVLASWMGDSSETALRLARSIATRPAPNARVAALRNLFLTGQLAARGRLRESWQRYADSVMPRLTFWASSFPELALFGAVPPRTADSVFGRAFEAGAAWPPSYEGVGLSWWFSRGDTAALRRFAGRADAEQRGTANDVDRASIRYLGAAAGAYLALDRGDTTEALRRFEALPDSACGMQSPPMCLMQKFTEARLRAARGEDRRAADILDHWVSENFRLGTGIPSPVIVLARLDRAQLAERLGERELAVRYYQFVADIWRGADPSLQRYVTQARAGLERLTGERS